MRSAGLRCQGRLVIADPSPVSPSAPRTVSASAPLTEHAAQLHDALSVIGHRHAVLGLFQFELDLADGERRIGGDSVIPILFRLPLVTSPLNLEKQVQSNHTQNGSRDYDAIVHSMPFAWGVAWPPIRASASPPQRACPR